MVSNSSRPAPAADAPAPEATGLKEIIDESKAAISAEIPLKSPSGKKRGRPSKADIQEKEASALAPPPFDPKPAGFLPVIKPALAVAGAAIASRVGVPEVLMPEESVQAAAENVDLIAGILFPDVANSKWGAVTALSLSTFGIYFSHYALCKQALNVKLAEEYKVRTQSNGASPAAGISATL